MESLTAERLEQLERLAAGTVGGEWEAEYDLEDESWCIVARNPNARWPWWLAASVKCLPDDAEGERHARYMAAANPATVLALIARILELEDDLRVIREVSDELTGGCH